MGDAYETVARRLLARELDVRAEEVAAEMREAAAALRNGEELDRRHYNRPTGELERAEWLLEEYLRPLVEDDPTAAPSHSIELPAEVADDTDLEEGDDVLWSGEE